MVAALGMPALTVGMALLDVALWWTVCVAWWCVWPVLHLLPTPTPPPAPPTYPHTFYFYPTPTSLPSHYPFPHLPCTHTPCTLPLPPRPTHLTHLYLPRYPCPAHYCASHAYLPPLFFFCVFLFRQDFYKSINVPGLDRFIFMTFLGSCGLFAFGLVSFIVFILKKTENGLVSLVVVRQDIMWWTSLSTIV